MADSPNGARLLALGSPEQRPAWLRETEGEHRWWVVLAFLAVIVTQLALPSRFVPHPAYILPTVETIALIVLTIAHPIRSAQRKPAVRTASLVFLGLVAATNGVSLGLLIHTITTGEHITAVNLLAGGGAIWLTNVIVFGVWYWEWDRGGPAARAKGVDDHPDLLFAQMTDDHLARDWEPQFVDYLYVSFTNSTAFSPTDTMPLSRWTKVVFTLQELVSLVTIGLIVARAVNILPS